MVTWHAVNAPPAADISAVATHHCYTTLGRGCCCHSELLNMAWVRCVSGGWYCLRCCLGRRMRSALQGPGQRGELMRRDDGVQVASCCKAVVPGDPVGRCTWLKAQSSREQAGAQGACWCRVVALGTSGHTLHIHSRPLLVW